MNLIIIPCLDPNEKLIDLVNELKKNNLDKILVVDDGSKNKDIFNKIDAPVIHHEVNKGKGAAIKSAIREYDKYYDDITGFITVDCDGQHKIQGIKKINDNLKDNIILGVRNFNSKNVPLRSKIGNKISSIYFKMNTGVYLSDTQTGLRGIPLIYKDILLNTKGNRFEYEMNFLYNAIKKEIKIDTINIETVYENNNKNSHFHVIRDSYLIYQDVIKFTCSSIMASIIDLSVFALLRNKLVLSIFMATVIARILSGLFNYFVNKIIVFKSDAKHSFLKFFIFFIAKMGLSGLIISIIDFIPINTIILKAIVDVLLFMISYFIEKKLVF